MHGHLIEKQESSEVIIDTTGRNRVKPPLAQTYAESGLRVLACIHGSQLLEIMQSSEDEGNEVSYRKAYLPISPTIRRVQFDIRGLTLNQVIPPHSEKPLFCTEHDCFGYYLVEQHVKLVTDTGGRYHTYKSANLYHA